MVCCGQKSVGRYQPNDDQEAFPEEKASELSSRIAMYEHDNNSSSRQKSETTTTTTTMIIPPPLQIQEPKKAKQLQSRIASYENVRSQDEIRISQTNTPTAAIIREDEKAKQLQNRISSYEKLSVREEEPIRHQHQPSSFPLPPDRIKEQQQEQPCCSACLLRIYPTDPILHSFGETLHVSCFVCYFCNSKMFQHPLEVQFRIPDQNTLFLLCSKCQEQSINSRKERVLGKTAGEKIRVEKDEEGNIEGVMEAIGDELEELLLDHVPKCAICGIDFLYYTGELSMVGDFKYHRECFERGTPGTVSNWDRPFTPLQAVRYLPERLLVKVRLADSSAPIVTLFFVWTTKASDFQRIQQCGEVAVKYCLDETASANQRKPPPIRDKSSSLVCELVGTPFGVPCRMTSMVHQQAFIVARLVCSKFQLQHVLSFHVRKTNNTNNNHSYLDLASAMLTVQIPNNK
jgi:hypothetical protein